MIFTKSNITIILMFTYFCDFHDFHFNHGFQENITFQRKTRAVHFLNNEYLVLREVASADQSAEGQLVHAHLAKHVFLHGASDDLEKRRLSRDPNSEWVKFNHF